MFLHFFGIYDSTFVKRFKYLVCAYETQYTYEQDTTVY